ncbi:MAG: hypothetical protein K0B08_07215 [Bacteroidales bacterium]|nr:hypothetical protein [Bacteroidales bacterium]
MKRVIIALVIIAAMAGQGLAQEKLKIGEAVNGRLKITNETGLRKFLMNELGKTGVLGKEIYTEVSPTADRFLAYLKVTGNSNEITTIAVLLANINNNVYIVANPVNPINAPGPGVGGSVTYTCTGEPCSNCDIKITWPAGSWTPDILCVCKDSGGGICNLSVSVTFKINVGL